MVAESKIDRSRMYPASKAFNLNTANGKVAAKMRYRAYVPTLDDYLECVVLPNTPAAISLGQLVANGYSFNWLKGSQPQLFGPNQIEIDMHVDHDVPYVWNLTFDPSAAMAAAPEEGAETAPLTVFSRTPAASEVDPDEERENAATVCDDHSFDKDAPKGARPQETAPGAGPLWAVPGRDDDAEDDTPDTGGARGSAQAEPDVVEGIPEDPRDELPADGPRRAADPVLQPGERHPGIPCRSPTSTG